MAALPAAVNFRTDLPRRGAAILAQEAAQEIGAPETRRATGRAETRGA